MFDLHLPEFAGHPADFRPQGRAVVRRSDQFHDQGRSAWIRGELPPRAQRLGGRQRRCHPLDGARRAAPQDRHEKVVDRRKVVVYKRSVDADAGGDTSGADRRVALTQDDLFGRVEEARRFPSRWRLGAGGARPFIFLFLRKWRSDALPEPRLLTAATHQVRTTVKTPARPDVAPAAEARRSKEARQVSRNGPVYWDPFDRDIAKDPYPVYQRLRSEAPLYYNDRHDFYVLSRYEDIDRTLTDWKTFSSARGPILEIIKANIKSRRGRC